ncbi:MAG: hypothetical protein Q4D98_02325 [Planctomycetia bacterium]|nr:hypothetical protein [Planctomycetia bacterium]
MKKSISVIVAGVGALLFVLAFSEAAFSQRYMGNPPVGTLVPTEASGAPIYANQHRYFGVGDCTGDCGYRAVGPAFGGGACGTAPCDAAPCGPVCDDVCGPCDPCMGPACGGFGWGLGLGHGPVRGLLAHIWNGRNYWQGTGCSERVIDELRKSWQTCRKCDLVGQNINGMGNTIGTGLNSGQLMSSAYVPHQAPIPMEAGYTPNVQAPLSNGGYNGYNGGYAPVPANPGGGCSSCQKGITVTSNAIPANVPAQYMAARPTQNVAYAPQVNAPQANVQQVQYVQTPQGVVPMVPVSMNPNTVPQLPNTGAVYYQANYTPSGKEPGYITAQRNAQSMQGIGFNEAPATRSAYAGRTTAVAGGNAAGQWVTVPRIQQVSGVEVIPTPPARTVQNTRMPSAQAPMAVTQEPVYSQQAPMVMGTPSDMPAAPMVYGDPCGGVPCGPMGNACAPCGPCGFGCGAGPCFAGPGIVPGALRLVGRVAYGAGQVVAGAGRVVAFGAESAVYGTGAVAWGAGRLVVGTGRVAVGATRAVACNVRNAGVVFVSGPAGPIGCCPSGPVAPCYSPYLTGMQYAGAGVATAPVSGNAGPGSSDPLYQENDAYLNMDFSQNRPSGNRTAYSTAPATTGQLLSQQSQRVVMADGTEVFLEYDGGAGIETPRTSMSQVSYNAAVAGASASTISTPAGMTPVTNPALSQDGYPIVAAENPQISLAPGEVLVSQQDFVLTPPENAPKAPQTLQQPLQPAPQKMAEPAVDGKTVQVGHPTFRPVSYAKPVVVEPTFQEPSFREPSLLKLKAATPL